MKQEVMRYRVSEKVKVLPVRGLHYLFNRKERRRVTNLVGTIISSQLGASSKLPIYTISLENGEIVCLFEDELELVATKA